MAVSTANTLFRIEDVQPTLRAIGGMAQPPRICYQDEGRACSFETNRRQMAGSRILVVYMCIIHVQIHILVQLR
jgi:hypothetical protein